MVVQQGTSVSPHVTKSTEVSDSDPPNSGSACSEFQTPLFCIPDSKIYLNHWISDLSFSKSPVFAVLFLHCDYTFIFHFLVLA